MKNGFGTTRLDTWDIRIVYLGPRKCVRTNYNFVHTHTPSRSSCAKRRTAAARNNPAPANELQRWARLLCRPWVERRMVVTTGSGAHQGGVPGGTHWFQSCVGQRLGNQPHFGNKGVIMRRLPRASSFQLSLLFGRILFVRSWSLSPVIILPRRRFHSSTTSTSNMVAANWESTWDDILNHGGNTRWKIDDLHIKEQALQRIVQYCHQYHRPVTAASGGGGGGDKDMIDDDDASGSSQPQPLHIFCPLAGDDPFVALAWQRGHTVTTIDLVAAAVALQRQQINGN
jgi:hypothetical protein